MRSGTIEVRDRDEYRQSIGTSVSLHNAYKTKVFKAFRRPNYFFHYIFFLNLASSSFSFYKNFSFDFVIYSLVPINHAHEIWMYF